MTHPSVYSRRQIIEAAFELIRERGWSAVSTRAIARKLGSSTMPIYSHVRSVEELEKELRVKTRDLLKEFQKRPYTPEALLNVALGYIAFARDEANLFRFLFLEKPDPLDAATLTGMRDSFVAEFGADSDQGAALLQMSPAAQEALVQHTWIFTHGLAMLVNSGALGACPDSTILRLLSNAGEAFYHWASQTGGNDDHD